MANVAEDLIISLCRLYEVGAAPVYGHRVLARSALETCARSAWVGQPGIGAKRRVGRIMSERLYSIDQAGKLPTAPAAGKERRKQILAEADRLDFKKVCVKGQSVSLVEARPRNTAAVRRLFGDDELGSLLYGQYSAVAHATLWGLVAALETNVPQRPGLAEGVVTAGLMATSHDANNVLRTVTLGYTEVLMRHHELFGWEDVEWRKTVLNLMQLGRQIGEQQR